MMFSGESGEPIEVADPLEKKVRHFLTDLESGKPTDKRQMIASMIDLKNIVESLQI